MNPDQDEQMAMESNLPGKELGETSKQKNVGSRADNFITGPVFVPLNARKKRTFRVIVEDATVKTNTNAEEETKKRTHESSSQARKDKAAKRGKKKVHSSNNKNWSRHRYETSKEKIWKIMKENGAVLGNPISRQDLEKEARKHIRDTGLLGHLLKDIEGKRTPDGKERFCRLPNSASGAMEYWLESVDPVNIRRDTDVNPLPGCKLGDSPSQDSTSATELNQLKEVMANFMGSMKEDMANLMGSIKEEMANIKGYVEYLSRKNSKLEEEMYGSWKRRKAQTEQQFDNISTSLMEMQKLYESFVEIKAHAQEQLAEISHYPDEMQETYESLVKIKAQSKQQPAEISNSLKAVQEMNESLLKRKVQSEQQLVEISKSLMAMQKLYKNMVKIKVDGQQQLAEISHSMKAMQEIYENLVKGKARPEQLLAEISNSLKAMQEMYERLVKAQSEQQLSEISDSLKEMQEMYERSVKNKEQSCLQLTKILNFLNMTQEEMGRLTSTVEESAKSAAIEVEAAKDKRGRGEEKKERDEAEKTAKRHKPRSAFTVCKPPGTFLWPNMGGDISSPFATSTAPPLLAPPQPTSPGIIPKSACERETSLHHLNDEENNHCHHGFCGTSLSSSAHQRTLDLPHVFCAGENEVRSDPVGSSTFQYPRKQQELQLEEGRDT